MEECFVLLRSDEVRTFDANAWSKDLCLPCLRLLTLIYLLIHFSLIAQLPVHIAVRIAGICWDRKLQSAGKN